MTLYHDTEWGVPVHDDRRHFEYLALDAFQAGLSWRTVLYKRPAFERDFAGFDPVAVAGFSEDDAERLMSDAGIIRNRAKITGTIINARQFLEVAAEFGSFDAFVWEYVQNVPQVNAWQEGGQVPVTSPVAEELSHELRRRGFKFVGPTICYAYLQAAGLVNDHLAGCFRYAALASVR